MSERIFSGKNSKEFWDAINKSNQQRILYEYGCKAQMLESINADLLEACDKVRDWLDTSSLQQILVHYTEDKRRHSLIMGIASHLERLEAAIAKAKKEG